MTTPLLDLLRQLHAQRDQELATELAAYMLAGKLAVTTPTPDDTLGDERRAPLQKDDDTA